MNRFILALLALLALLLAIPAQAADNAITLQPGVGVTERSIDVGAGVQSPGVALVNDSGTSIIGAGTSVPISGSVTASGTVSASQSGTWTIQPGNTPNTTAWLVTGTGGTFPVTQSGAWSVGANITQWNSVALGSPTAWGTAPTGNVAGMNVNLVACVSGGSVCVPLGQAPMGSSTPVVIANNQSAIPVSGTVTVTGTVGATQSGTWTVQPGNTANTTAWLVTGTGGVFPSTQSGTWTVNPGNVANTTAWLVTGAGGTFPVTQSGTWTVGANITQWNSVALGSPTAWGTAPTGNVAGMNVNLIACATAVCNVNGQAPMAASAPVVIANNQTNLPVNNTQWNSVALGSPTAWGTAPTGNVIGANVNLVAGGVADPCTFALKTYAKINQTTNTQIVAGVSAKKTYICSFDVVTATAQGVALVEGTGTVCATNTFGLAGGATAALGWPFAANSGIARGSGSATWVYGSSDANATAANICLFQVGSGQISGTIGYVQQ